jgi:excisionase family DNA binding protein
MKIRKTSNDTLTLPQAAPILKMAPWKLRELVRSKAIAHLRLGGRILFQRDVLTAYVKGKK